MINKNLIDKMKKDAIFVNTARAVVVDRNALLNASHPMHTLTGENGCTRICHYGPSQWHLGVYLYQVVVKVRIWLEVYENHLKTGYPLDKYLSTAPER